MFESIIVPFDGTDVARCATGLPLKWPELVTRISGWSPSPRIQPPPGSSMHKSISSSEGRRGFAGSRRLHQHIWNRSPGREVGKSPP